MFKFIYALFFFIINIQHIYAVDCSTYNNQDEIQSSFTCDGNLITNNPEISFSSGWGQSIGNINGNFIINNTTATLVNNYILNISNNFHSNGNNIIIINPNTAINIMGDFIIGDGVNNSNTLIKLYGNGQLNTTNLVVNKYGNLIIDNLEGINIKENIINNGGNIIIQNNIVFNNDYEHNNGILTFDLSNNSFLTINNKFHMTGGNMYFAINNNEKHYQYTYKNHYEYDLATINTNDVVVNNIEYGFVIYNSNGEANIISQLPPHLILTYEITTNPDGSQSVKLILDRIEISPPTTDTPYKEETTLNIMNFLHDLSINGSLNGSLSDIMAAIDLISNNGENDVYQMYDSLKPIANNTLLEYNKSLGNVIHNAIINDIMNWKSNLYINTIFGSNNLSYNNGVTEGFDWNNNIVQVGYKIKDGNHLFGMYLSFISGDITNDDDYYNINSNGFSGSLGYSFDAGNNINILYLFTYGESIFNGNRNMIYGLFTSNLDLNNKFYKHNVTVNKNYILKNFSISPFIQLDITQIINNDYMEEGDGKLYVEGFKSNIFTPKIGINLHGNVNKEANSIDLVFDINMNLSRDIYKDLNTYFSFIENNGQTFYLEDIKHNKTYAVSSLSLSLHAFKSMIINTNFTYESNFNQYQNKTIGIGITYGF